MAVQARPTPTRRPTLPRPELRLVEARRRRANLHLFTYIVGNALFWSFLGALSISTDHWYWWPIVPLAGWTLVLALHLWHAARGSGPRRGDT